MLVNKIGRKSNLLDVPDIVLREQRCLAFQIPKRDTVQPRAGIEAGLAQAACTAHAHIC
jgi:hypothetical protein